MSDTVVIYGHSDDLIEIRGAIHDEIPLPDPEDTARIEFNTGDLFKVTYDGEWKIKALDIVNGMSKADVLKVGTTDVYNDYSEVCIFESWDELTSVEVQE